MQIHVGFFAVYTPFVNVLPNGLFLLAHMFRETGAALLRAGTATCFMLDHAPCCPAREDELECCAR